MTDQTLYNRFVLPRLTEALADTPVVLIHGPRQCGKTTLARMVGDAAGYAYTSFDDDVLRAAAQADPVGFVADLPEKAILDEVQRVPELFTTLKAAVSSHTGLIKTGRLFSQCVREVNENLRLDCTGSSSLFERQGGGALAELHRPLHAGIAVPAGSCFIGNICCRRRQ